MKALNNIRQKALLLLLLLAAGTVKAQSHEFAPVGAEWHYGVLEMFATGYIRMSVEKDTVINGIDCIKLQREKHVVGLEFNELHSMVMEPEFLAWQNDSCLFLRDGQFYKLFDFGANIGDSVVIKGLPNICFSNECKVFITGKGTETVNGVPLRYFDMKDAEDSEWGWGGTMVGDEAESIRVYERIGPVGSYFFPEQRCLFDYAEGGVLRCYEDHEIGYLNYTYPYYTECDFITDLEEHFDEQSILVYPNPCDEMVYVDIEDAHGGECTLEVFDVMGNLMFTSSCDEKHIEIAMDRFAQGVYLLKVTTKRNPLFKTLIKK